MRDTFTVVIVRDWHHSLSGLTLHANERYTARDGRRAGHYEIHKGGEWFVINADIASVVHDAEQGTLLWKRNA